MACNIPLTPVVYQIRNLIDGKVYIGSTGRFARRMYLHKTALRYGKHANIHLQRAFTLHGESSFSFEILEDLTVYSTLSLTQLRTKLLEREQYYIDNLSNTYNFRKIAESNLGCSIRPPKKETREQMSLAHRNLSDQQVAKALQLKKEGRTTKDIATLFSMSPSNMSRLLNGRHNYTETLVTRKLLNLKIRKKLTTEDKVNIRIRLEAGESQASIASYYKIDQSVVSRINTKSRNYVSL